MADIFDRDLLPCPFCGAPAEWEYTPWDEESRTGDDGSGWVECTGCHVQMTCGYRDEAVERWNKRAPNAKVSGAGTASAGLPGMHWRNDDD